MTRLPRGIGRDVLGERRGNNSDWDLLIEMIAILVSNCEECVNAGHKYLDFMFKCSHGAEHAPCQQFLKFNTVNTVVMNDESTSKKQDKRL